MCVSLLLFPTGASCPETRDVTVFLQPGVSEPHSAVSQRVSQNTVSAPESYGMGVFIHILVLQ